jgi:hypothetical protein
MSILSPFYASPIFGHFSAHFKEVLTTFLGIFDATDDSLDKINQFQECWRLQNMIEPYIELISENATLQRQLIKEGSLNKISRKNGAPIQRHLILVSCSNLLI